MTGPPEGFGDIALKNASLCVPHYLSRGGLAPAGTPFVPVATRLGSVLVTQPLFLW